MQKECQKLNPGEARMQKTSKEQHRVRRSLRCRNKEDEDNDKRVAEH
jgi:hypothetical protein